MYILTEENLYPC